MKIVIDNCRIVDDNYLLDDLFCIVINDGIITDILPAPYNGTETDEYFDARGNFVSHGFVDLHCHLREPGYEYKEDIMSGTRSAAKGGFTAVCAMANTNPVTDSAEKINALNIKAKDAFAKVYFIGAVTKNMQGRELCDFKEYSDNGVLMVSDDGVPVSDDEIMKEAMLSARDNNILLISHCEDMRFAEGCVNESIAKKLSVKGISEKAETEMVLRDCKLAYETGCAVHIAHISTAKSVEIIKKYKKKGAKVTCETAPHYFSLTEEVVAEKGSNAKMNPPLRTLSDKRAIIKGIWDKTIDVIATDHAPHARFEKERGLEKAPNGIIGFETALALCCTYLFRENGIPLIDIIKMLTVNPAKIAGIGSFNIKKGGKAELVVFSPFDEFLYREDDILSKSVNSPFIGERLYGKIYCTIKGNAFTYKGE